MFRIIFAIIQIMRKVLDKKFFSRPVAIVARQLIGKYLVRKIGEKQIALMITETEAYDGETDLGCHASKGRTKRTEVLYGEAGHFYVYLCYGMYWMLNAVTDKKEYPAAVLIRGAGEYNGPGKLTKALKINRAHHGKRIESATGLWIEDRGNKVDEMDIEATPRIGILYAGPIWSKKLWRFVLKK